MSITDHPNVHAVGLMLDLHKAIMGRLRGQAEVYRKELEFKLLDEARLFSIHISELLDREVGDHAGSSRNSSTTDTKKTEE